MRRGLSLHQESLQAKPPAREPRHPTWLRRPHQVEAAQRCTLDHLPPPATLPHLRRVPNRVRANIFLQRCPHWERRRPACTSCNPLRIGAGEPPSHADLYSQLKSNGPSLTSGSRPPSESVPPKPMPVSPPVTPLAARGISANTLHTVRDGALYIFFIVSVCFCVSLFDKLSSCRSRCICPSVEAVRCAALRDRKCCRGRRMTLCLRLWSVCYRRVLPSSRRSRCPAPAQLRAQTTHGKPLSLSAPQSSRTCCRSGRGHPPAPWSSRKNP